MPQLKVLVVAHEWQFFLDQLTGRFPDVHFEGTFETDAVREKLTSLNPQVILALKDGAHDTRGFRLAIDHPSVEWFQVAGSGYEHVAPWDASRVTLSNCAGLLARYLSETVLAGMLMLSGNFLTYGRQQAERQWRTHLFKPLCGATLAVVGVGHIGAFVAQNAQALGMHVIGLKRTSTAHPSVDEMLPLSALSDVLPRADFVSLHLRDTAETRHIIDAQALAQMRPGSFLVNTGRGALVDEKALINALTSGHLGGAYLDVFETEPLPESSPLWSMENVIITPHSADLVHNWRELLAQAFAENLERKLAGQPLRNVVAPG